MMLRSFVLILLVHVVTSKTIHSFRQANRHKHLDRAGPEWSHDYEFSKSVLGKKTENVIGYKDLGETINLPVNEISVDPNGMALQPESQSTPLLSQSPSQQPDISIQQTQSLQPNPLLIETHVINENKHSALSTNRVHIMMTCGGCLRSLPLTELWADLLLQSHIDSKTKNIRHLYALRGPDHCASFDEYNFEAVSENIFNILTADSNVQLISIAHSSGGDTCGLVLKGLMKLDVSHNILTNRVTHISLDAGLSGPYNVFVNAKIFHEKTNPQIGEKAIDGLLGYYAEDSESKDASFNKYIADKIDRAGGIKAKIDSPSNCSKSLFTGDNRSKQEIGRCEHFALLCRQPPHVSWAKLMRSDCPQTRDDLESSYLDKIPFD